MVMEWTGQLLGNSLGMAIELPVGKLLVQNLVLMMVPIILGITIRAKWYAFSQKLHDKLSKIAFPGLIVLISIFFIQNYEAILNSFGQLGLCVTTLILLAMGGGVLITWILKLQQKEQRTIVIEIGMQNAAQAIAAATSPFVFNNNLIAIPAILYALMMNVILLTYVWTIRRKAC
jgi:BASS family bile acid:Na+ symporter